MAKMERQNTLHLLSTHILIIIINHIKWTKNTFFYSYLKRGKA